MKTILVIGGTGAQGIPVVKALSSDSQYAIRVLTRDPTSPESTQLSALPNVTLIQGNTYSEPTLRHALRDGAIDTIFANTNGFAIGEKAEIYWGIRLYELAREYRVRHFIYAGLEYASKLGGFDPKYRCGHLDAKGKVVEFLSAQPTTPMTWSVLTSCMYVEALTEFLRPVPDPKDPGLLVFAVPLGQGKCPLIYLEDYGRYVRWMVDHPGDSSGLVLHVATEDIGWGELVETFRELTGKRAVYRDVSLEEYFSSGIFRIPEAKVGRAMDSGDDTLVTYRENFSGFWNTWKDDLTKRDYALLDRILPTRVKSIREWMELVGYTGKHAPVLKDYQGKAKEVVEQRVVV
ncbi:NAD(P)-binding protein [Aspergillus ellipticus CBS 707.79]|uniref:NAD(P)-binding protein n=1 Tax=Aspergillus ellipticus CBS 707.79 TaxID=1448320 RepID=A0A319DBG9_9EURO|nr:NAD(P)-binding protein [Aspergillus ellipticus CBS 707.79]